jgi:hypothetical protein
MIFLKSKLNIEVKAMLNILKLHIHINIDKINYITNYFIVSHGRIQS